jgi:hypothetical protein
MLRINHFRNYGVEDESKEIRAIQPAGPRRGLTRYTLTAYPRILSQGLLDEKD